ncbi:ABC transporter ATP-binding protein [Kribbella monticola]|uniref:ABC transporter ATP-binding protein n=1 Tax=Kribbella monticola TaxID=2185285 RepID=UPI000DD2DE69|nr:ABC transporter ATP-binding protein [Kribbella monticola]
MPTIALQSVSKSYGVGPLAVDDLDLTIPDGSFTCLLGPSGCGKTTTLRMIAGLEHPTEGSITVGDRVLDSVAQGTFVPTERRGMGLVFQNYALWPHLTVRRNVEFGLRVQKVPAAERKARVDAALEMMQIDRAADRYPSQLSGGQQQRVSLARMLAVNPSVLLLDEPLSNLDATLRLEMRAELKRLHEETGHTIVFVTHDQLEAMTMATQVAVMKDGVLQQLAPPMDVYHRPANTFVAAFVGSPPMNLAACDSSLGELAQRYLALTQTSALDAVATIGVRPEAVRLVEPGHLGSEKEWVFEARVRAVLPTGAAWTVSVTVGSTDLYLVTTDEVGATSGDVLRCAVKRKALHLFDAEGNRLDLGTDRELERNEAVQWIS